MGLLDNDRLEELNELFDKDNKVDKVHIELEPEKEKMELEPDKEKMKLEPDKHEMKLSPYIEEMKIDILPQKPKRNFDELKIDNRLNLAPILPGDKLIEAVKESERYKNELNYLKETANLSKDQVLNIDILFDTIGPAVSKYNESELMSPSS